MGNTIQIKSNQGKFFRAKAQENFSNDPSAFRVFVKKRNKFIPGWLKINDEEILFSRGGNNFQFWPLAYLRRYGYTCSGIFFFESGRRCASGEGLHTFQSHQAERIFQLVQSKIKIEEYARGSSRASSVLSTLPNVINPAPLSSNNRIHPVQRFCSEGTNNDFLLNPIQSSTKRSVAPSPQSSTLYSSYNGSSSIYNGAASPSYQTPRSQLKPQNLRPSLCSDALYRHRQYPPNNKLYNVAGNLTARMERPRSVVSAIEQRVIYPKTSNTSSASSMIGGNSSYNTANIMNCSYNSTLGVGYCDSNGAYSPWQSQQQLEGEIVMEHVLKNGKQFRHPNPNLQSNEESNIQKYHSYVNIDMSSSLSSHQIRELHRTSKSRQEFLSSQPGGFVFSSNNNSLGLPNRAPSAASSVATVSTILPPLSPLENSSKLLYSPFHQNGNLLSKQNGNEDIMSKSAFASLSHTNRILEFDSASLRVPSPAANLGNNNNQRNYITVAVGIQERKLQNWDKLNLLSNSTVQNFSNIINHSTVVSNKNNETIKNGINYALIDFDKTKTLEKVTNNLKQKQKNS